MLGLLQESWQEIASRPKVVLQCFWLAALSYLGVLFLYGLGALSEVNTIIAFTTVIVLFVCPGAVRWHRHVIQSEIISWVPRMPDLLSLVYAAKSVVVFLVSGMSVRFFDSVSEDLLLPIYGFLRNGHVSQFEYYLFDGLGSVLAILVFAIGCGAWLLHLPEGALDQSSRGVRKNWPPNGKKQYWGAMIFLNAIPAFLSPAVFYFIPEDFVLLVLPFFVCLGVVTIAMSLSLLTVTYRRNMDHAGLSFGKDRKIQT